MQQNKNMLFCKTAMLCGTVYTALCIGVRIMAGSPYGMIHKLDSAELIPPIWIFNLLWMFWSFLSGASAGMLIQMVSTGRISGRGEIFAYRGGLFFISLLFFSLIWYPVLFINEALFLSLCIALASVICSGVCAYTWYAANKTACLIMTAYTVWLIYVLLVNLSVFVHN